ncbi:MAG: sterol desaturase family protein, partial [Acidimicrobiales bacterium]
CHSGRFDLPDEPRPVVIAGRNGSGKTTLLEAFLRTLYGFTRRKPEERRLLELRQPWSGYLMAWIYFPMPLLGIPLHHTMRAGQLNLLYQYWIHTELIDRLPQPVEAVFNTPSHHRVHHGANLQYLDKNHGGALIIWDKLFGTFEPEVRRVKYGLTKNIETFNPIRIGYHEFVDIVRDVRKAKGLRTKLGYVFKRPGWRPDAAPTTGGADRAGTDGSIPPDERASLEREAPLPAASAR